MTDRDSPLDDWVGRTHTERARVDESVVACVMSTFDRAWDHVVVPPLVHWCLFPSLTSTSELDVDGHPMRGGVLPPVDLPRRMWAGGRVEWLDELRLGDEVERNSTVADVVVKDGRSGRLVFVTVDHVLATDRGVAIRERQDIVYRALSGVMVAAKQDRAERSQATWERPIATSPVMLFRYSAVTFNAHRIHYDQTYATDVEGYPGLVVHGPLMATALCWLAADCVAGPLRSFDFRALQPAFADDSLTAYAAPADGGLNLWVANSDGVVHVSARVE